MKKLKKNRDPPRCGSPPVTQDKQVNKVDHSPGKTQMFKNYFIHVNQLTLWPTEKEKENPASVKRAEPAKAKRCTLTLSHVVGSDSN
ncbi:MAG: hypothetical protein [Microvirus sp.]|nr:MAG: hypothetical protein [Microvirus sp.]